MANGWRIERGGCVGFPRISNHAVEQLHREGKQLTGWEKCQCRQARIQRNHIGCALLVWLRLKALALADYSTVYKLKNGLLQDYLIQQLKNPSLKMILA